MKDCAAHNRIYRVIWNRARCVWMVVGESAKGLGKGSGRRKHSLRGLLMLIPLSLCSSLAMASPTGGAVTSGSGSISQSGTITTIHQSSQNLSLSWKTFNVGSSETVNFNQPNSSAVAVNRIYDTNGSRIMGHLNANGNIYLINPNGILFGATAQVNVGGLVASTLDTTDGSTFAGNGTGTIVNEGTINAAHYVALLGNSVTNSGVITARLGTVAMGAGNDVSLTFSGNNLIKLTVNQSVVNALVANHGLIEADGGLVIMNAGARDSLLASVVNNDGVVEAQTISNKAGTIELLGGMAAGTVNVGGTLDASAPASLNPGGGNGGAIETSAHTVNVADNATITTAAANGLNGSWLIDPYDFTIAASGGNITGSALSTDLASASVTIRTATGTDTSTNLYTSTSGNGDIYVNDAVTWNAGTTLTLNAYRNIYINKAITSSNAGGKVALLYGQGSTNGVIGGTSASYSFGLSSTGFAGQLNLQAGSNFSTKLGSSGTTTTYTVIDSLGSSNDATTAPSTMTLQGMAATSSLTGHYVLGANIDASATSTNSTWKAAGGFTPIGNGTTNFTGVFDGLNHTISNLYISRGGTNNVGLFGGVGSGSGTSALVRNVGLSSGYVKGKVTVGELVGYNDHGTISNAYATGSNHGTSNVGGLVGANTGTISNAYATGSVVSTSKAGGLVGYNSGTISDSYATGSVSGSNTMVGGLVGTNKGGTISNSYATGSVTGGTLAGGLVGINFGTISNAYATGSVSGSTAIGGLVGANDTNSIISDAYATGSVSGSSNVGGLVGTNVGTISNGYWDNKTFTGSGIGGGTTTGATGLSTAALSSKTLSSLFGSVDAANWGNGDGQTTPYLKANSSFSTVSGNVILGTDTNSAPTYYGVILSMTQLQDINTTGLSGKYVLGTNLTDTVSTGSGFTPLGSSSTSAFTGSFDGLNHTISSLYISRSTTSNVGLFGYVGTGGKVNHVGLVGGSVTGKSHVGELVGYNFKGAITDAYATGSVNAIGSNVGGLVGYNAVGTITDAYATGSVNGTSNIGGLVGWNTDGLISDAYATGSVNGTSNIGGLVGHNAAGTISDAYATGSVTGSSIVGGLVGSNASTVSNGYWDNKTFTGPGIGGGTTTGATGLSTAALSSNTLSSLFGSVDAANWGNGGGQTTPYLKANASFGTVSGNVILGTDTSTAPTYYGVIQSLNQLQNINTTGLSGKYVLGTNLTDTVTTGSGFTPIGNSTTNFTGTFDGLGHTISNLYINRGSTNDVGLFGYVGTNGAVRNIGLSGGSVTGATTVGALVGFSDGTVSNAYATSSVSGSGLGIGGLVGDNRGTISNAYASGSVSGGGGGMYAGGLVGDNPNGTISDAYATGSVSGSKDVGGLVGGNRGGTISNAYATGSVSGSSNVGGLVGGYAGTTNHSYWDNSSGPTASAGGTGESTANMQSATTFSGAGWSISSNGGGGTTWRIYNNQSYPLLESFLTPITVTANNATKTYDGLAYSGGNGVIYSATPNTTLLGTVSYGGTSQGAMNVNTYTITPTGLYSTSNQGYDVSYASGQLTVNKAALTVTADAQSRLYGASNPSFTETISGYVNGENATSAGVTGSATGSSSATATSSVGSYTIIGSTGTLAATNYSFTTVNNGTLTITKAPLTVTATGASKTYGQTPTLTAFTSNGLQNGETIGSVTETSAGTAATASVANGPYTITPSAATGGTFSAGNYSISYATGQLTVNPASLTVTANAASKTYDGLAYSGGNGVSYSGFVNSESSSVLGGTLSYGGTSQGAVNAGSYVIAPSGLTSANYTLSFLNGALTINPAQLSYAAATQTAFNGLAPTGLSGTISGLVGGDSLSTTTGTLAWSTLATKASPPGSYAIDGSGLTVASGNYLSTILQAAGNATALTISPGTAPQNVLNVRTVVDQTVVLGGAQNPPGTNAPGQGQHASGKGESKNPVEIPNIAGPSFIISGSDKVNVQFPGVHLPLDSLYLGDDGKKSI